jgi:hypothetical protein
MTAVAAPNLKTLLDMTLKVSACGWPRQGIAVIAKGAIYKDQKVSVALD